MISVLYNIILITNFKLIEMCIKSSPTGEGKGEGPAGVGGGATVSSMRERIVLCEKGKVFKQTENVRIFHNSYPSLFEETLFLNEEDALQHSRTCLSWSKNMPLLM